MLSDSPQAEGSYRECRPDPEEMLQQARGRKEKNEKAIDLIRQLDDLNPNIYGKEVESLLAIIGKLQVNIWNEEKAIQRLLEEIDK